MKTEKSSANGSLHIRRRKKSNTDSSQKVSLSGLCLSSEHAPDQAQGSGATLPVEKTQFKAHREGSVSMEE